MARGYLLAFLVALPGGCSFTEPAPTVHTRDEVVQNLTNWVAEADQNRDGRLDKIEWQALVRRDFPDTTEADRRRSADRDFAYYDRNGDNFIVPGELSAVSLVGFDCLDTDHDGRLSATEQVAAGEATCVPSRSITE